ncbi:glutathione S-transferase N-terminal domain-containing protein [Methylobacterium durans]|uniref:GST N-terminal domain-containing protein n=1 Tax=Methylobacterium durans TaxID=2202825 RepID=A0A2U8W565_9HYPH|nr:glutathione S-transferase N-terminal domain-containing protein [Methylobacterium durans]AWN40771.1 hypothetical protein DK389_09825 [Methylobacterium durans]
MGRSIVGRRGATAVAGTGRARFNRQKRCAVGDPPAACKASREVGSLAIMVRSVDAKETSPRLYVMKISHYCERARWGLDYQGIRYDEQAWAPALHVPLARRLAKQTNVPILVAGERVVQGSGAILSWAGLNDGDTAMERRFETVIGPLIRAYVYAGTLHDPRSGVREVLLHGVSPLQAALGRAGWPVIRRLMANRMGIRPERLPDLARRIESELDWADALVEDGAPLSRGFGRTAITAASILAPLARPDALPLYRQVRLQPEMERAFERWSARPALRWVLNTYAQHRHCSGQQSDLHDP